MTFIKEYNKDDKSSYCTCYDNGFHHACCNGTRERDECTCEGNPEECDFYDSVKKDYKDFLSKQDSKQDSKQEDYGLKTWCSKLGDTVYYIDDDVYECTLTSIQYDRFGNIFLYLTDEENMTYTCALKDAFKKCFSSQEEAEEYARHYNQYNSCMVKAADILTIVKNNTLTAIEQGELCKKLCDIIELFKVEL